MNSCNNQTVRENKIMKLSKKIIRYAFLIVCVTSSASAMLKPLGENCIRLGGRYFSTIATASLSDKFTTFKDELCRFRQTKNHLDLRNQEIARLRITGSDIFKEVTINPTDSLEVIDEKTKVAKDLFDLQSYFPFVAREDVILACNISANNATVLPNTHLTSTMKFIATCVHYPFPLSLRITYPHIEDIMTPIN
jgi:hypothetical protein